jgi:exonuclease SbcC
MRIKGYFTALLKLLFFIFLTQVSTVYGQDEKSSQVSKTNLQDKYYRQALYYYFQNDNDQALLQIEKSKAKLSHLESRSALFEAGLQLSAGLLQQAKKTLINFNTQIRSEENTQQSAKNSRKASELLLISLLSLTEQYLKQGNMLQAKDTLSRIDTVSPIYYPQYHVLSQLAYWPNKTTLLANSVEQEPYVSSPYIQLNSALRLIENSKFEQAIKQLKSIKRSTWHNKPPNFWQTLFLDEATETSLNKENKMAIVQGQAIQDYAQLLLAQIYISQERYSIAFSELKSFPEQSPYTESALFLFAFASQQVQQYDTAFNLLSLLYTQYPTSELGWQSAELMAEQVTNEQSLAQGVGAYQIIESFFLKQQQDLNDFEINFSQGDELLSFSQTKNEEGLNNELVHEYSPESIWLQKALYNPELAHLYQALISTDALTTKIQGLLDKTIWLAEIIALNQQRKKHIVEAQLARDHQGLFNQLKSERDRLTQLLSTYVTGEQGASFANKDEQQWINRIKRSNNAIAAIGTKKNTVEYQQRLVRVNGVLSWQLSQQYPERSWQQTKQLKQIDKVLIGVEVQQQQLAKIANTDDYLKMNISKHGQSVKSLNQTLTAAAKLRQGISLKIRQKVNIYIKEQNVMLAGHILSTRQGMANVLERMTSVDKALSLKVELKTKPNNNKKLPATTEAP